MLSIRYTGSGMTHQSILDQLKQDGIVKLSSPFLFQVSEWLKGCPCYNAHVKVYSDKIPRRFWEVSESNSHWCHDMQDVLKAPGFLDFVLGSAPLIKEYLGDKAHLYSVNAYWSQPTVDQPIKDLQTWHRDKDDEAFLALFVYGTDILDYRDGPHCYQVGSHTGESKKSVSVCGPAGTAFLCDPRGLHRGAQPKRGQRCLLWARWGVSEVPASYTWDELQPVDRALVPSYPTDPELQNCIRLVVA